LSMQKSKKKSEGRRFDKLQRPEGQHVTRFSKRFLVIDRVACVSSLQKYFFSFDEGGGSKNV
jgi:phage terminase small subunit